MACVLYVDLSAKVEHWTKDSAVAISNDHCRVLFVPGKTKQRARALIRSLHGGKSDQYRLLAALVYLVVRDDLHQLTSIVIDKDYAGERAEATIKNLLLALLRRDKPEVTAGHIRFEGLKGSRADRLAKQVYDGKAVPDHVVSFRELEALLRG